jgi:uncharacterized membrane protein
LKKEIGTELRINNSPSLLKMERIKSIDIFRGFMIIGMLFTHLRDWWVVGGSNSTLNYCTRQFTDRIFGSGFLFIAGVSVYISYSNRLNKSTEYSQKFIRSEYFVRTALILLIALLYNVFVALMYLDVTLIWTWFVLFSIAVSLFLAWPLLKTPKLFRVLLVALILLINEFLLAILAPFEGTGSIYGLIYHLLFNSLDLDPILSSFCFLLIGTVIGNVIVDLNNTQSPIVRKKMLKNKILLPCFICGVILILYTLIFIFPPFFHNIGFNWVFYAMGACLIFLATLLIIEEKGIFITKRNYRFLYYFSFYSLLVYLSHNVLFFVFNELLNFYNFWFFYSGITIIMGVILRMMYKKWGTEAALKIRLSKYATRITMNLINEKQ